MEKAKKTLRRKGGAITLDEVAALARVSAMTVSRVVNGHAGVRQATRDNVLRAIQTLGYSPNLAASTLATAQHLRIALVYRNPSDAYLRELLVGLLQASSRTSIQLVVDHWQDPTPEAARLAARRLARSVAGVILPPPLCESRAAVQELVRAELPVVAVAAGRVLADIACVRIDDYAASKELVEYLIAQGHTRIGFIHGDPALAASARRFAGFKAALAAAGIAFDRHLQRSGDYSYRSALSAAEALLARRRPPTAIFASNDDMAAAVVSVAHRRGLSVPEDLSVVGFDDTSAATTVWPELTTIHQPIAAMADRAVALLLRSLRGNTRSTAAMDDQVIAHRLVKRGSVAAPPISGSGTD